MAKGKYCQGKMVPTAGLEPARVSPPPPQDGVSTNSTTSARFYFVLAGNFSSIGAGIDLLDETDRPLLYIMARTRLVNIKMMTTIVVTRVMKPDVPELPKSVWLAPLPKAAPISDPRPVCSSTMRTRAIAAKICTMHIAVVIFTYQKRFLLY